MTMDATTQNQTEHVYRIVFQHIRLGNDVKYTFDVRAKEEWEARSLAWTQLGYSRCTNWFRLKEISVIG